MKKCLPDIIISIVLLGFLASLAMQLSEIPDVSRNYPTILIAVAALMSGFLLVKSVLKYKTAEVVETNVVGQLKIILPFCLMIIAYLILMGYLGYIISTVVFMIAALCYLRMKNKIAVVILALAMTIVIYFVFTKYLIVVLPFGKWINIAF